MWVLAVALRWRWLATTSSTSGQKKGRFAGVFLRTPCSFMRMFIRAIMDGPCPISFVKVVERSLSIPRATTFLLAVTL
jgi:hypothetical protein